MQKKKTKNKPYKLCQKCLIENKPNADVCSCGSDKFAPEWVKKIEKINRQFCVQITEPNKELYGDNAPDRRITLYKWWPGASATMHINKPEEWEMIQDIVCNRLWGHMGWKTRADIVSTAKMGDSDSAAKLMAKQHPELAKKVLSELNFKLIKEEDLPEAISATADLVATIKGVDSEIVAAIKSLIKKLPKQGKRAIEDLENILSQWNLKQVNAVTLEVKHRIDTLDIFENAILNDKTYEIRGDGSIHRILEKAMWIVDERYWLMHSNQALLTIVGDTLEKDRKHKKKRPDFVCGSIGEKVIIIEIKRPSHTLKVEDLNQLETYLAIIESHTGGSVNKFEAYLVGKKIDPELRKRMKYRASQFKIKTYTDLLTDVKKRYLDYYKNLK
ncbi:MAG: hypothetical protein HQ488_02860 [Parcubacteria group bacterium]|nr:hypothetical protein [Parcubacteria group bacterium]